MKLFLFGFLLSIITNFFLFNKKDTPVEFLPAWQNNLNQLTIQKGNSPLYFPILHKKNLIHINTKGKIQFQKTLPGDKIHKISGNGKYYASYEKTGTNVEYSSSNGLPLWKKKSQEYPFISYNGKLILLMVSDLSMARVIDFNGNFLSKPITGKTCITLVFSNQKDYAALGFLNGSYRVINEKGKITIWGKTPDLTIVKSLFLSDNGQCLAVHYGDTVTDFLRVIDNKKNISYTRKLPGKHITKTALYVDNKARCIILNKNQVIITDPEMEKAQSIKIPEQAAGQSNITSYGKNYLISYRMKNNSSRFIIMDHNGSIIKDSYFKDEPYLECYVKENSILLRGEKNLYSWRAYH